MIRLLLIFTVVSILASCVRQRGDSGGPLPATAALMRAVPSDAMAVLASAHGSDLLSLLDSTDAFRSLDLGRAARRRAVLSCNYDGGVERLLVLDVAGDTTIVPDLSCLGASARQSLSPDGQFLLISESANLLGAALRHLRAGTSILEAAGFEDALCAAGHEPFAILKNAALDHLPLTLPEIPGQTKRSLLAFLRSATRWTVVFPDLNHREQIRLLPVQEEMDTYYMVAMGRVSPSASQLAAILPAETEFAVSIPIAKAEDYLSAREKWLDANVRLTRYNRQLDALRQGTGHNPRSWAADTGIQELALVRWDGSAVLAYRSGHRPRTGEIEANPAPEYFAALFGSLFDLPDESSSCTFGKWTIVGSATDIEKFVSCETRLDPAPWPEKNILAVIYGPDGVLRWTRQGIEINLEYGIQISQ